jgi:hypothetical protein
MFGELMFRNSLQFLTIEKEKGICDEIFFVQNMFCKIGRICHNNSHGKKLKH